MARLFPGRLIRSRAVLLGGELADGLIIPGGVSLDDVRATAHAAVTLCDRFEAMAAVSRGPVRGPSHWRNGCNERYGGVDLWHLCR
jgi:hypothetical protein